MICGARQGAGWADPAGLERVAYSAVDGLPDDVSVGGKRRMAYPTMSRSMGSVECRRI